MALIRCKECGKQVSSNAGSCLGCGNPIGGKSVGDTAFERRIEQYKASGYNLTKRSGDEVTLVKAPHALTVLLNVLIPLAITMLLFVYVPIMAGYIPGFMSAVMIMIIVAIWWGTLIRKWRVIVSFSKTGKVEERGNVLKN